jgi:hypothetical protein
VIVVLLLLPPRRMVSDRLSDYEASFLWLAHFAKENFEATALAAMQDISQASRR